MAHAISIRWHRRAEKKEGGEAGVVKKRKMGDAKQLRM